jgi:serine/threonine protein kinase
LSDFGLSLKIGAGDEAVGRAGTYGYMAPEMMLQQGYDHGVDYWALGITLFELFHGRMPWHKAGDLSSDFATSVRNKDIKVTEKDIASWGHFKISSRMSKDGRSLLRGLLNVNRAARLGISGRGWQDVKQHSWFKSVDWDAVAKRTITPPIKPGQQSRNSDAAAALSDQFLDEAPNPVSPEEQKLFVGFEYNVMLPPQETHTAPTPALTSGKKPDVSLDSFKYDDTRPARPSTIDFKQFNQNRGSTVDDEESKEVAARGPALVSVDEVDLEETNPRPSPPAASETPQPNDERPASAALSTEASAPGPAATPIDQTDSAPASSPSQVE